MEEVDKIIIHSLRDIGCDIEDEIQSLESFSTEMIVQATGKCLKIIQPEIQSYESLPQNMAARFHVGSALALACKDLGFNGDVGYQTFLYSNVGDVRRVFMFLIEKLPREVEKQVETDANPVSKLMTDIGKEIRLRLGSKTISKKSVPFISVALETGIVGSNSKLKGSPKDWKDYVTNHLPFLTEQTNADKFFPSAIALNTKGLIGIYATKSPDGPTKQSDINNVPKLLHSKKSDETWLSVMESVLFSKVETNRENLLDSKKNQQDLSGSSQSSVNNSNSTFNGEELPIEKVDHLKIIKTSIDELQVKIKEQEAVLNKVEADYRAELEATENLSKDSEFHEKALSLLPECEENLKKLENNIKIMSEKILSIAAKWESHRKPLIENYMALRNKMANEESQNEKEYEKSRLLKGKIEVLSKQLVSKKGNITQLEEEYDKLPKNINRSAYTHRIMEIIGNIRKQKDEIKKILKDTKDLQKEINILNGRLERLFTLCEETIFKNMKKEEFSKQLFSKQALNLLTTLHSDCSTIGSLVLEIGVISREITDLREQIEIESSKNTNANLERITADLEQMKAESKSLTNQIKKLQSVSDVNFHPLQ